MKLESGQLCRRIGEIELKDLSKISGVKMGLQHRLRLGLIGIGLVECPDKVRGIPHMFLGLPAGGLQCVIKARPLNKVQ